MNENEKALVNRAWELAIRFRTYDEYKSFLRGFRRSDDSPALKAAIVWLLRDYEVFYS